MTATPNHALQPTATAVTACAADRRHLSTHRHRPRQPPPWLSLGSLGVCTVHLSSKPSGKELPQFVNAFYAISYFQT